MSASTPPDQTPPEARKGPPEASKGPEATPAGPTAVQARALAPDLARGFMLLFIALANAHVYLYAREQVNRGYPASESGADQVVAIFQLLFVDGRSYPMFSFLFGYGMVQLMRRQEARGADWTSIRALLRRRGWWMLAIGGVHGIMLWSGDIIGAYGVTALLWVGTLRAKDRTLLRIAGGFLIVMALFGSAEGLAPTGDSEVGQLPSVSEDNPLMAMFLRTGEWFGLSIVSLIMIVPAALIGIWAGRRRILDEPERNRPFLATTAGWGLATAALGGLPLALLAAGIWAPEQAIAAGLIAGTLNTVTGYAGGIGWAALIGLVAVRIGERRGPISSAVAAVGQRSMSCYLMQSVVFVAVFAPYTGGLGGTASLVATAMIAAGTWAVTVIFADVMRRSNYRGPAEKLLRRLTYHTPVT